jgi:ribosome maturation factor RimP
LVSNLDLRVEKIWELTERVMPDDSYFVVDVKLVGKKGYEKVVVLVDGDKGISIDVCAEITRSLSNELDAIDIFDGSYTLEISSPGVDYPLSSERQYIKNLGRLMKIDLISGDRIKGDLLEADALGIKLNIDKGKKKEKENLFIPFSDIKSSKVLVTFK